MIDDEARAKDRAVRERKRDAYPICSKSSIENWRRPMGVGANGGERSRLHGAHHALSPSCAAARGVPLLRLTLTSFPFSILVSGSAFISQCVTAGSPFGTVAGMEDEIGRRRRGAW